MTDDVTYTAFMGDSLVVSGTVEEVLRRVKTLLDQGGEASLLIFEDQTGRQVDFDLRGSVEEVVALVAPAPRREGPGRPRLGVVSREVSLLPRHWEWLEEQRGSASAALRRLVDEARRQEAGPHRARRATDATGRVMTALAGNRPGFEEAYRALYAGDGERFRALVQGWPDDIRRHLETLSVAAFAPVEPAV